MSKVVYKYNPPSGNKDGGIFEIEMPIGAKIIHLNVQEETGGAIWAMVDPDAEKVKRKFWAALTGETLRGDLKEYIGSWVFGKGSFVLHVFEIK